MVDDMVRTYEQDIKTYRMSICKKAYACYPREIW